MAFSFTKEHVSGVSATYWKLFSLNIDAFNKNLQYQMGGWVDEAHFKAGKSPLIVEIFEVSRDNYPFTDGGQAELFVNNMFENMAKKTMGV